MRARTTVPLHDLTHIVRIRHRRREFTNIRHRWRMFTLGPHSSKTTHISPIFDVSNRFSIIKLVMKHTWFVSELRKFASRRPWTISKSAIIITPYVRYSSVLCPLLKKAQKGQTYSAGGASLGHFKRIRCHRWRMFRDKKVI